MGDFDKQAESAGMTLEKIDGLETWAAAFLRDRKAGGLSAYTVEFYRAQLAKFITHCGAQNVTAVMSVTPDIVRGYLLDLESQGRNAGGRHAAFRALRAFLRWYEDETEPEGWANPIRKVKPPKVTNEPIKGVPTEDIKAMLATCGGDFVGIRDRALLLCLFDTGARAAEFTALDVSDIDFIGGAVDIRKGKGGKSRTVFVGRKSRKALRAYIRARVDNLAALWVTNDGTRRLAVKSLRPLLARRADLAGVPVPSPHDFRRSFALSLLRAGVDVFSIQRLMGHSTLDVLRRYLAQDTEDLRGAHERGSPADGM